MHTASAVGLKYSALQAECNLQVMLHTTVGAGVHVVWTARALGKAHGHVRVAGQSGT